MILLPLQCFVEFAVQFIYPLGVDALAFVGEIHKEPIKVLHYGVVLTLHGLHPLVLG